LSLLIAWRHLAKFFSKQSLWYAVKISAWKLAHHIIDAGFEIKEWFVSQSESPNSYTSGDIKVFRAFDIVDCCSMTTSMASSSNR
jgi:hypothetical protein